jgi:hypothetical protein
VALPPGVDAAEVPPTSGGARAASELADAEGDHGRGPARRGALNSLPAVSWVDFNSCMLHACCRLNAECCMLHAACCMLHVACCRVEGYMDLLAVIGVWTTAVITW